MIIRLLTDRSFDVYFESSVSFVFENKLGPHLYFSVPTYTFIESYPRLENVAHFRSLMMINVFIQFYFTVHLLPFIVKCTPFVVILFVFCKH